MSGAGCFERPFILHGCAPQNHLGAILKQEQENGKKAKKLLLLWLLMLPPAGRNYHLHFAENNPFLLSFLLDLR